MERHDSRPRSVHDHDRYRRRVSDTSSEEARRRKSAENGSSGKEDMSRLFFRPIREDLKKVSGVTKENYANKMDRALELRRLLRKIGDFIGDTLEGEKSLPSLEKRLW